MKWSKVPPDMQCLIEGWINLSPEDRNKSRTTVMARIQSVTNVDLSGCATMEDVQKLFDPDTGPVVNCFAIFDRTWERSKTIEKKVKGTHTYRIPLPKPNMTRGEIVAFVKEALEKNPAVELFGKFEDELVEQAVNESPFAIVGDPVQNLLVEEVPCSDQ